MLAAIQPAGSPASRKHYQDTIERPVDLAANADVLAGDGDLLMRTLGVTAVPMWGVTPGTRSVNETKYRRLSVGDIVVFTRKKQLFASGTIAALFQNAALARRLWGEDEAGATWEFMYALRDVRSHEFTYDQLRAAIASRENDNFMGFRVVDESKAQGIAALLAGGKPTHVPPSGPPQIRLSDLTDRAAVLAAINEYDALGRVPFLAKYGFHASRSYFLIHGDREYDTKPLLAAAYGVQYGVAPKHTQFSGGDAATARQLRSLGFEVVAVVAPYDVDVESVQRALDDAAELGTDAFLTKWGQNASAKFDIAWNGASYPAKAVLAVAEHYKTGLPVRPIREKQGNRSSVADPLRALGFDVVEKGPQAGDDGAVALSSSRGFRQVAAPAAPVGTAAPRQRRFEGKLGIDYDARSSSARQLGLQGELRVLEAERDRLIAAGRADLADRVVHVSQDEGDGTGYDIRSFGADGSRLCLEVKTTTGPCTRAFQMSANEFDFMLENAAEWRLVRVFTFDPNTGDGEFSLLSAEDVLGLHAETTDYRLSWS